MNAVDKIVEQFEKRIRRLHVEMRASHPILLETRLRHIKSVSELDWLMALIRRTRKKLESE